MLGEAAGRRLGGGAASLGLSGEAGGGQLGAILEGRDPATGERPRVRAVEVTGFDVTLRRCFGIYSLLLLVAQGLGPGGGERRLSMSPTMAHLTNASWVSGRRS